MSARGIGTRPRSKRLPPGPILDYEDGSPIVPVTVQRTGTVYLLHLAACPFCGRPHVHGGGPLDEDPCGYEGHRRFHCSEAAPGRGGYILRIVEPHTMDRVSGPLSHAARCPKLGRPPRPGRPDPVRSAGTSAGRPPDEQTAALVPFVPPPQGAGQDVGGAPERRGISRGDAIISEGGVP